MLKLHDKVKALRTLEGEVTFVCNHSQHSDNRCVDVTLTNNTRYTLKFTETDLELIEGDKDAEDSD